jgi:hypothetical protein
VQEKYYTQSENQSTFQEWLGDCAFNFCALIILTVIGLIIGILLYPVFGDLAFAIFQEP